MRGHPLVEQAHATLCRLADAPPATEAVKGTIADIERAWEQPFAAGIGGDVPSRTELFNLACADKVLDPFTRELGSAAVRIRRGKRFAFRAVRNDGTVEEHALAREYEKQAATARARLAAAQGEVNERENALVRVGGSSALPKRPPWWALWLWPFYWIALRRARRRHPERSLADLALTEARGKLETLAADAVELEEEAQRARQRYIDALRSVASGGTAARIMEVDITVAESALPENIELVELAGATRASAEVDAVFLAKGDQVFAPASVPIALGDHGQLLAALPAMLADARALRLAKRVETKIKSVIASLADAIERKEAQFRDRLHRLQTLRIEDPRAFASEQVERVRGDISASVNTIVEHASVHLGSELQALQNEWIGSVATAPDAKALDAALAKIEGEWDTRPRRIAEEVGVLVMGGVGGIARDLFPKAALALRAHGLADEHLRLHAAPVLPPVVLLPSLTKDARKLEKQSWIVGLFRSFDAKRNDLRDKVKERALRMTEVAGSELMDAEPKLHQAIGDALAGLVETAVGQQSAWLDGALDAERAAIAKDRETITPLVHVHDAVRAETYRLGELIAQLERHQPAVAVAAAAAETASLSR